MTLLNYAVGWQSYIFLAGLLQYLAKNMALLVQTFLEDFFCQNLFSAILRQNKFPMATKGGGVGKALAV